MTNSSPDTIKVGGFRAIPIATASEWVSVYTDAQTNIFAPQPFAFPAYDQYRAENNQPSVLDDADFLAPALLNVAISIKSFYALQRHREPLQDALAAEALTRPLAVLSDEQIEAHVGGLFAILDEGESEKSEDGEPTSSMLPDRRDQALQGAAPQAPRIHPAP